MYNIFVSYRRQDSEVITGRIIDRLKNEFPQANIFHDIESIPAGVNFLEYTKEKLSNSTVFIPIIGHQWLNILNDRSSSEYDYVKIEIEQALQSGIPIIPVTVENALFPGVNDLPASLKSFALLNGTNVRTGKDFNNDVDQLIETINVQIIKSTSFIQRFLYELKYIHWGFIIIPILVAVGYFMIPQLAKQSMNNNVAEVQSCNESKISTIIAQFNENDDKGLSNTILTHLDGHLPDSVYTNRTTDYQDRNIDRYYEFIDKTYFANKCDSTGLFVNGYINEENNVFNFYAANIRLELQHPDYLNKKKIVMSSPDNIQFSTKKDAQFIADFISLLLLSKSGNDSKIIEETYRFQKKYNLTKEQEAKYGNKSVLSHVYLIRANSYAMEGNDKRANQFYKASNEVGNKEVSEVANLNKQNVQPIVDVMYEDVKLRKVRAQNIQRHKRIESEFEKFIKEIGRILDDIFKSFKGF